MTFHQWRKFQFFTLDNVPDQLNLNGQSENTVFGEVTCHSSGFGIMVIGDSVGNLHFCDLESSAHVHSAKVFLSNVILVEQLRTRKICIAIGEDGDKGQYWAKSFILNDQKLILLRIFCIDVSLFPKHYQKWAPVPTSLALHENIQMLAVGFSNGLILVHQNKRYSNYSDNNGIYDAGSSVIDGSMPERTIRKRYLSVKGDVSNSIREDHESVAITSISFDGIDTREENNVLHHMFVCSKLKTVCFTFAKATFHSSSRYFEQVDLDNHGSEVGSSKWVLNDPIKTSTAPSFLVVRQSGIFFYTHESRAQCYLFSSNSKLAVDIIRSDISVTPMHQNVLAIVSEKSEDRGGREELPDSQHLNIFDMENKLVLFSCVLRNVVAVFNICESTNCDTNGMCSCHSSCCHLYVLLRSNHQLHPWKFLKISRLPFHQQMKLLKEKNCFNLALNVARQYMLKSERCRNISCPNVNVINKNLSDIHKCYGDHLYKKGDFSSSIDQFIEMVKNEYFTPSSEHVNEVTGYVVSKFMDSSTKLSHLVTFIEKLRERGRGVMNMTHLKLLVNCFVKLKGDSMQRRKFDHFLQDVISDDSLIVFEEGEAEELFHSLKQSNLASASLCIKLAEKRAKPETLLRLLIDEWFDDCCLQDKTSDDAQNEDDLIDKTLHLISHSSPKEEQIKMIGNIMNSFPSHVLRHSHPHFTGQILNMLRTIFSRDSSPLLVSIGPLHSVHPFMVMLVNTPDFQIDFITHLFAMILNSGQVSVETNSETIYPLQQVVVQLNNLLVENYLHFDSIQCHERLVQIIQQSDSRYLDSKQILYLCKHHNFIDGLVTLFSKNRMYSNLLRYHGESSDFVSLKRLMDSSLLVVDAYSNWDCALDVLLKAFDDSPTNNITNSKENVIADLIIQALKFESHDGVSSLPSWPEIMRKVSRSETVTFSCIREFLRSQLLCDSPGINQVGHDRDISLKNHTVSDPVIDNLIGLDDHNPHTQSLFCPPSNGDFGGGSIDVCDICKLPSQSPMFIFFCSHTFHANCFKGFSSSSSTSLSSIGGGERLKCPRCEGCGDNVKIRQVLSSQGERNGDHDSFHHQLQTSDDPMSVIHHHLSRSLFSSLKTTTDSGEQDEGHVKRSLYLYKHMIDIYT